MTLDDNWECSAYGPGGLAIGAVCFIAGSGLFARVCPSAEACSGVMAAERQRIYNLIQEKAAAGNPEFVYLAAEFPRPDMLLGGAGSGPSADG